MKATTEIAPRAEIGILVGYRDRALEGFASLQGRIDQINGLANSLNPDNSYLAPTLTLKVSGNRRGRAGTMADLFRRRVDGAAWRHLLDRTELRNLMGAKQRKDLVEQLETDPPEFTLDNITATFEQYRDSTDSIFRQSVVDVFEQLPRDFRSHDGFKIGARCIFEYAVRPSFRGGLQWVYATYYDRRAMVRDLDRALHTVSGTPWAVKADDIAAAAMERGETECETRFMRLRFFKNGNAHAWLTDKKATADLNRILADHYGAQLAHMALHPDERRRAA